MEIIWKVVEALLLWFHLKDAAERVRRQRCIEVAIVEGAGPPRPAFAEVTNCDGEFDETNGAGVVWVPRRCVNRTLVIREIGAQPGVGRIRWHGQLRTRGDRATIVLSQNGDPHP